ncbi:PAS domain-containing sensor histidine kinase [Methylobacter sp.]|uniref:PAS domain-containing sensor histidine kinase n=1 Tax=Methylobacter sp. TaxID=2051955 RepID=UPI002FDE2E3E
MAHLSHPFSYILQMQPFIDFFSINDFTPHGYCLSWKPALLWLHVISDLLITLAYYSIPLTLIYFIRKRKDFPYPWLTIMFAGFIIACGTTHLFSAITIWTPLYWLDGLVKALTAIISVTSAVMMLWIIPRALSLPSITQLQAEIEQRKAAENALRESEYRWKFAVEGSGDGLWDWNILDNTLFYSKRWKEMLGFSEDEIGTDLDEWEKRIHPDDKSATLAIVQAYLEGNIPVYAWEHRVNCKNGSWKWILDRGMIVSRSEEGKPLRMIGTFTDISEFKQMEEKLRDSDDFNASILDSLTSNIAVLDAQGTIVAVNKAWRRFAEENGNQDILVGINYLDVCQNAFDQPYGDEANTAQAGIAAVLSGELETFHLEYPCHTPDQQRWFYMSVSPLQGSHRGAVVSHENISERKRREQQNKKHLDELAHVTRLGLMGEMASGIAHEVNQPLAAISSYTQVSINLINTENPDLVKLTEILSKTQQQALRAGRIIHRMRDFVKSHVKHRSAADVNALIYNSIGLCMADFKQNSIKLTFALANNLPPVYVDQIQIEQVIINLIRNSIEALQSLPVKQQRQIEFHTRLTANNDILVELIDNGPGLDEDNRQQILTPFYTTKTNGMGMGLSISRSIIEAHEGTLHFNSQHRKGASFYFTLPLRDKLAKNL